MQKPLPGKPTPLILIQQHLTGSKLPQLSHFQEKTLEAYRHLARSISSSSAYCSKMCWGKKHDTLPLSVTKERRTSNCSFVFDTNDREPQWSQQRKSPNRAVFLEHFLQNRHLWNTSMNSAGNIIFCWTSSLETFFFWIALVDRSATAPAAVVIYWPLKVWFWHLSFWIHHFLENFLWYCSKWWKPVFHRLNHHLWKHPFSSWLHTWCWLEW